MPEREAHVGVVLGIDDAGDVTATAATAAGGAGAAGGAQVRLESGAVARLDPADPRTPTWRSVLTALRAAGQPAYLEIDTTTGVVAELLVPLRVTVGGIEPAADGDGVEVDLVVSHARHHLRTAQPRYDELLGVLRRALSEGTAVLVTETRDEHEIIDVRLLPRSLTGGPLGTAFPPGALLGATGEVGVESVPASVAQQMFALVNGRVCCSTGPAAPCIPFTYPDDGCWGRAHEMTRLMAAAGVPSEKIWIYGNLHVATANHPGCAVNWGWHVAPVLRVDTGAGPQVQVVDPALFPGPVPRDTWVGVQGDPAATTVLTSSDVFWRGRDGTVRTDPTYTETNSVLATYRAQLQLRSASPSGPPPYPQCMTRPPGVQWYGTLAPGETRRWFTFGWPAAWHVVWSVVPLTVCPGAPALSWSTAVERADPANATYWITVRNLTNAPVRFEGRYDVLSR